MWNASDCFGASCKNRASVFEWHKRFKDGRESVRNDERFGRSKEINTQELIGQRVRVRATMLRFEGSSGRDFVGRGQHSSNRVSGISSRTMHQSISPSLLQTIWPKWASTQFRRCPWCNGYRHRIWTRRYEFKSWTRLIAFHIALIPLGKVWIQLFSLQLWVNSRAH